MLDCEQTAITPLLYTFDTAIMLANLFISQLKIGYIYKGMRKNSLWGHTQIIIKERGSVTVQTKNIDKKIEVIVNYFNAVDAKDFESVSSLFDQNVEVFFPQSGLLKGLDSFNALNRELAKLIVSLDHDIENFTYIISDTKIAVEGTESGTLQNNQSFKDNKFCSVFEIDSTTLLIKRMYVYTNPNFGTSH